MPRTTDPACAFYGPKKVNVVIWEFRDGTGILSAILLVNENIYKKCPIISVIRHADQYSATSNPSRVVVQGR